MRSYEFLWAASIPLCFKHHTGHPSCVDLRAKECPQAHAPLLRLPSDKPSFDVRPLGLSHHEGKVAKGEARSPASLESPFCNSIALQEIPTPGNKKLK